MNANIRIYRLITGQKVGSLRLLLYVMLGYVLSARWDLPVFMLDAAIVTGGIFFASLLNDYYDYLLLGEQNEIGRLLEQKKLSRTTVLILIWLPWLLALILFLILMRLNASPYSLVMLWISFILALLYCQPPARLKCRPGWGIIVPPLGIFLLYLQALLLTTPPRPEIWLVSGLVFLYTWYLDFLHLAEDAVTKNEFHKMPAARAIFWAKAAGIAAVILSVSAAVWRPFFLVSLVFWGARLLALAQCRATDIAKARKNLFSPLYHLEEFAFYALWFLWG